MIQWFDNFISGISNTRFLAFVFIEIIMFVLCLTDVKALFVPFATATTANYGIYMGGKTAQNIVESKTGVSVTDQPKEVKNVTATSSNTNTTK